MAGASAPGGGDDVDVLPVAVGEVVARDEDERVALADGNFDGVGPVVVEDDGAHAGVGEVLDGGERPGAGDGAVGCDAAAQQVLDDEPAEVAGGRGDDDGHDEGLP